MRRDGLFRGALIGFDPPASIVKSFNINRLRAVLAKWGVYCGVGFPPPLMGVIRDRERLYMCSKTPSCCDRARFLVASSLCLGNSAPRKAKIMCIGTRHRSQTRYLMYLHICADRHERSWVRGRVKCGGRRKCPKMRFLVRMRFPGGTPFFSVNSARNSGELLDLWAVIT